jgi:hypothetical protein
MPCLSALFRGVLPTLLFGLSKAIFVLFATAVFLPMDKTDYCSFGGCIALLFFWGYDREWVFLVIVVGRLC